jgi:hypothetical protein
MANKLVSNGKIIDLKEWCTQAKYAASTGYKLNTISRWVKRAKDGEGKIKIEYLDVPELDITLVRKIK